MSSSAIKETFVLPSHGRIYKSQVDENVTLRSMNTEDEMRRQSHSSLQYKTLCDLIDSCIEGNCGISSYDMCMGDYQFLLYKLRTVTYGSKYLNSSFCPYCGNENIAEMELDDLEVYEYTDDMSEATEVKLPVSNTTVQIRYTTPRDLDEIETEKAEYRKQHPDSTLDMTLLFTLKHNIVKVNDNHYDYVKLDKFLRELNMKDTNILLQSITKLNDGIGVNTLYDQSCKNAKCGLPYKATFRIWKEFFRPTI